MKYLKLYEEWSKTGVLPDHRGLCWEFGYYNNICWKFPQNPLFTLMFPTYNDIRNLKNEAYWASDHGDESYEFGPLRQNIVLLMAAMNGEL